MKSVGGGRIGRRPPSRVPRASHSGPFPLPDDVFPGVTRVACGIFHPDPWRVIATAPGDGFWSKYRKWGWWQRINVLRVTRVTQGWKIPQAHEARVTNKTFRSFRRAENAFCGGGGPPFLMKERARDARGIFRKTLRSCSFSFLTPREEFTVQGIG